MSAPRLFVPLGVKIGASICALVVLLVAVFAAVASLVAARKIGDQIMEQGARLSSTLAAALTKDREEGVPIAFRRPAQMRPDNWQYRAQMRRLEWIDTLQRLQGDEIVNIVVDGDAVFDKGLAASNEMPRLAIDESFTFEAAGGASRYRGIEVQDGGYGRDGRTWEVRRFSAPLEDQDRTPLGRLDVYVSLAALAEATSDVVLRFIVLGALALGYSTWLAVVLGRRLARPVEQLAGHMKVVAEGDLHRECPIQSNDEIGQLAQDFNQMLAGLRDAAHLREAQTRQHAELELARGIQLQLLPKKLPQVPGVRMAGLYVPAREVGGDYYDVVELPGRRLLFAIGDVSGKGVPASLVMSMVKGITRTAGAYTSAKDFVCFLNRMLYGQLPPGTFVTFLAALLDQDKLTVCGAGHNPALLWCDGRLMRMEASGVVLAVVPDAVFQEMAQETELLMVRGARVLLYTDGVTEAMDEGQQLYGMERLEQVMARSSGLSEKDFLAAVVRDVEQFRGRAEQSDDIALLTCTIE